jgi:hypothetical protein
MAAPQSPLFAKPLLLNLDTTLPFLRAVSYAIVAQRTTRMEWREDTGAIQALYAVFLGAFGTPGTAEVRTASAAEMTRQVALETHHRIDVLLTRLEAGPVAVAKYLADLDDIRRSCLRSVQQQYADANAINREIAQMWGRSTQFLATIELGSTVVVKGLGVIPGPGWAVALGYDVVHDTINDLGQAGHANAIVTVATEKAAKEGFEEAAENLAEKGVDLVNRQPTKAELAHALARVRQLEEKIASQSERLAQRVRQAQMVDRGAASSIRSLSQQLPRNVTRLDAAHKATLKATGKYALAKAVSWVFLTRDVAEAMRRYQGLRSAD